MTSRRRRFGYLPSDWRQTDDSLQSPFRASPLGNGYAPQPVVVGSIKWHLVPFYDSSHNSVPRPKTHVFLYSSKSGSPPCIPGSRPRRAGRARSPGCRSQGHGSACFPSWVNHLFYGKSKPCNSGIGIPRRTCCQNVPGSRPVYARIARRRSRVTWYCKKSRLLNRRASWTRPTLHTSSV